MTTKTYKLRFDFGLLKELHANNTPEFFPAEKVHQWLWDTHLAFNEGVDNLTAWLLRMHRGAGVCRERSEGIWGEWQTISTHNELEDARTRTRDDPTRFALIENVDLLKLFTDRGKSESEAVELAECCRRIAEEICPASEDGGNSQMPRDDLDLLTLVGSEAKGIRDRGKKKDGKEKKASGKRPGWLLDKAVFETCLTAGSLDELLAVVQGREEFLSAKKDGEKRVKALRVKHGNTTWEQVRRTILELDRIAIAQAAMAATSWNDLPDRLGEIATLDEKSRDRIVKSWQKQYSKIEWPGVQSAIQSALRMHGTFAVDGLSPAPLPAQSIVSSGLCSTR